MTGEVGEPAWRGLSSGLSVGRGAGEFGRDLAALIEAQKACEAAQAALATSIERFDATERVMFLDQAIAAQDRLRCCARIAGWSAKAVQRAGTGLVPRARAAHKRHDELKRAATDSLAAFSRYLAEFVPFEGGSPRHAEMVRHFARPFTKLRTTKAVGVAANERVREAAVRGALAWLRDASAELRGVVLTGTFFAYAAIAAGVEPVCQSATEFAARRSRWDRAVRSVPK